MKGKASFAALVFFIYLSHAANWYISPFGNNNNSGTSSTSPLADLKTALNKASIGDTIFVGTGTYSGPNNIGLSITGINIIGSSGSTTTIFQGATSTTSIFKLYASSSLQGLTANTGTTGVEIATGNTTALTDVAVSAVTGGVLLNQAQKVVLSKFKASSSVTTAIAFSSTSTTQSITITNSAISARNGITYSTDLEVSSIDISYTQFDAQVVGSRGIFILLSDSASPFNLAISDSSFTNYNMVSVGSSYSGAALYLSVNPNLRVNASISSTQFTNNHGSFGPSMYVSGLSQLYLFSVTVFNSTSSAGGGGFYINNVSNTTIVGSEFRNCTATGSGLSAGSGGAIYFGAPKYTLISETSFLFNAATVSSGGAIYYPYSSVGQFNIENSVFNGSYAGANGGAIAAYGTFLLNHTLFGSNEAATNGAAIFNSNTQSSDVSYILHSNFLSNFGSYGGAIYSAAGFITLDNGTFAYNSAYNYGAGIYASGTTFSLYEAYFLSNTASGSTGGGMYITASASVNIVASTFVKNSAISLGGGFYCGSSAGTLLNGVDFSENTAVSGSAYACSSCLVTTTNVYIDPSNSVSCASQ